MAPQKITWVSENGKSESKQYSQPCSSEASWQSIFPSQFHSFGIQSPLVQRNCSNLQVNSTQSCSSVKSPQSLLPSQTQSLLIQRPLPHLKDKSDRRSKFKKTHKFRFVQNLDTIKSISPLKRFWPPTLNFVIGYKFYSGLKFSKRFNMVKNSLDLR